MKYLYKGSVTTVLVLRGDLVEITPGQLLDLPEAPSSDFVLQEKPKKTTVQNSPPPIKRSYKKRTSTKKVVTDGSDSETSKLGE